MIRYYANEGKRLGPVDEAEFQALIETGVVTANTLVLNESFPTWKSYAELVQQTPMIQVPMSGAGKTASCCECGKIFRQDDMIRLNVVWICASCKPLVIQRIKEGVALPSKLEYGGFWIRFVAEFFDGLLLLVVTVAIKIALGVSPVFRDDPLSVPWFLNISFQFFYGAFFLGTYGATPGKMICRLKVVTAEGEKISYARAFARECGKILSALILGIGFIVAAFDEEKRTWHDRMCNTRVIRQ